MFSRSFSSVSQHVDGLPGGGCGSYSVEGVDGDVSYRETAQTGTDGLVCDSPARSHDQMELDS